MKEQESRSNDQHPKRMRIRWWPAIVILIGAALVVLGLLNIGQATFQERNIRVWIAEFTALILLLTWWLCFSKAGWRLRLVVIAGLLVLAGLALVSFRIRGVSGDLVPIVEPRWSRSSIPEQTIQQSSNTNGVPVTLTVNGGSPVGFPQFLGPERTGVIRETKLEPDWDSHPPQLVWKQSVGEAWSGFAVIGFRALTQEQRGEEEQVRCYELSSGRLIWTHSDPARYATTIAGVGPRCTPTVAQNRVYTLGATGILNCLDLATGRLLWTRRITDDAGVGVPTYGFSGSPLVIQEKVLVSAGGKPDKSVLAYDTASGAILWTAGQSSISYSSLFPAELAGKPQVLAFNASRISSHDSTTGTVLWEYPWPRGHPHVSVPVVVSTNRILFSSGYGVGSELLEIQRGLGEAWEVERVWKSIRMKAKMATLVTRGGYLYGLDDGMLACLDLKDGSLLWKEGRYGHGQGLLIDDLYLLMAENGELVLLRPTPEGPGLLHRHPVFNSKTWNPPALAGDLLLLRNDQEAACLRLALR